MIELRDIFVSNQGNPIFKSLHVRFESGVSYLIKGDNGVGKTTLLKLIAGSIQPLKGSIDYDFINEALDWQEKYELRKKHIHYVPVSALHELLSGELFYQQRYYSIESTPQPTVRDYLGAQASKLQHLQLPGSFSITALLDLELNRLSNGQVKKMIILKQLLDTIPKVLLLDYPFEGLDVKSRTDLSEFLNHLALLHKIQLIITGHEYEQLPSIISKLINLKTSEVRITDRLGNIQPNIQNDSKPVRKATEPVVELHDVTIRYGSNAIVENLTWIVNRGERWALTGRNGSGKTTLFSMIYADHPMAYSEKVFLFSKRRGSGESIWDIKKRISYLGPEQLHFLDYPTGQLTVREFLIQTKSSITQLNHLVDYFKIEPWLSCRLRQLSHGQLQLILMLALFLSQKELLLLDEPFQFLDPVQKARVNEYLHSHLDDSTTLILITHYEEDVARWTQHRLAL